jgi:ABC-2 type transport system permease protein
MMGKLQAFLLRDLHAELSYRFAFITRFFSILISAASFFFISKLVGGAVNPYLESYGGNYFAFVLIGIALTSFQNTGLGTFSSSIGSEQSHGTLEAMLVTPTKLSAIILASSAWDFFFTVINVLAYFAVGVLVFGLDLGHANIPLAILVLMLTVLVFSGMGILAASVIMVIKRGDPISWLFGSISSFISGAFVPTTVFPIWLQWISVIFPVFYSLRAMRQAVLNGASFYQVSGDVLVLTGFAICIIPLSIYAFKRAVGIAKIEGTLSTY